jgi:GTP-binding protein
MQITYAKYLISSPSFDKCPPADKPEFAFIGRSNVGKSSLINMLCNNDKLAKTSASPGKTQMINHFEIVATAPASTKEERKESAKKVIPQYTAPSPAESIGKTSFYIVDLPGYGFAKVSQSSRRRWEQMIENYLRKRENLTMLFVLIDSRHNPQKIDLEFLEQLKKWGVPVTIIFTKTDKESQRIVSKNIADFKNAMLQSWQFLPPFFSSSAVKKSGRDKILGFVSEINQQLAK